MEIVVLGAGAGVVIGRYVCPAIRGRPLSALISAELEAARCGERIEGLTRQLAEQTEALRSLEARREAAAVEGCPKGGR
jgi:hypothetical protein